MLELTALIQSLIWFSQYLSLAKFIIRTDHMSLTYLKNLKYSPQSKLIRFSMFLSEFDFEIEHIRGKKNLMADALSRRPFTEEEIEKPEPPPLLGLDPVMTLASITPSDEYFEDVEPTEKQLDKSRDRHYRRHAKVLFLMPMADLPPAMQTPPSAPDAANTTSSSAATDTGPTEHMPTVEEIQKLSADLPPINLVTQSEDEFFANMIAFLQNGILPADEGQARSIVKQSEYYAIVNDQLVNLATYHRKRKAAINPIIKRLCLPPQWRLPVMFQFHDALLHASVEKTLYMLAQRYYFKNMFAEITSFVKGCEMCQRMRYRKRPEAPMSTLRSFEIMEAIHIDFYGPVTPKSGPYNHIMVMTDHTSGYTALAPAVSTGAQEAADILHREYFLKHGYIPYCISDRGSGFLAQFTQRLFELCGIKHLKTTSWRPNMNSQAENKMKSITLGLRVFLNSTNTTWSRLLRSIEFSINVQYKEHLGMSPFNIIFNRHPRLPVDLNILLKTQAETMEGFAETYLPQFEIVWRALHENIFDNKVATEKYQNQRAKPHGLKPGDLVYKWDKGKFHGAGQKLRPRFTGPYKILSFLGDNAVRLVNILTGVEEPILVNVNHLKSAKDRRKILAKYWPLQTKDAAETAENTPAVVQNETDATEIITTDNVVENTPSIEQLENLTQDVQRAIENLDATIQKVQNEVNAEENISTQQNQQTEISVEQNETERSVPSNDLTDILPNQKVEKILRRQKVQKEWRYRVKMNSGEEVWLKASELPIDLLFSYNAEAARRRQITRQAKRSVFGQY